MKKNQLVILVLAIISSSAITYFIGVNETKHLLNNLNLSSSSYLKGATGSTGPQGAQGTQGLKGDQGQQGLQGPKGDNGQNPTGAILGDSQFNFGDITGSFNSGLKVNSVNGINFTLNGGNTGDVLTRLNDGTWAPRTPTAPTVGNLYYYAYGMVGPGNQFNDGNIQTWNSIAADPIQYRYGAFDQRITPPTYHYNPGDVVMYFQNLQVTNVDTRSDPYDIVVEIVITNSDGSQALKLREWKWANNSSSNDSVSIDRSDLVNNSHNGTDLVWNPSTGVLTTTNGGTYTVTVRYIGGWD